MNNNLQSIATRTLLNTLNTYSYYESVTFLVIFEPGRAVELSDPRQRGRAARAHPQLSVPTRRSSRQHVSRVDRARFAPNFR